MSCFEVFYTSVHLQFFQHCPEVMKLMKSYSLVNLFSFIEHVICMVEAVVFIPQIYVDSYNASCVTVFLFYEDLN